MSEHADGSELPELTDEDVELLYAICKRAGAFNDPPFKALFAAYDDILAEQQIEQEHDGVLFRYLMRVGESTRDANRTRRAVDLVEQLREVLEAHGVTFVEPSEDGIDLSTGPVEVPDVLPGRQLLKRRGSYDDARLEETWLSEYSERIEPTTPASKSQLLSLPPRRAVTHAAPLRRARSISSQRNLPIRNAAPKHFQQGSAYSTSEPDDPLNPTLLFDPSQTQLEMNAEAFLSTSAIRSVRQGLHVWNDAATRLREAEKKASAIAIAYDRRLLLTQGLNQLRQALDSRREDRNRLARLKHLDEKATRCRDLFLLTKAFTHWATSCQYEQLRTKVAQRYMLKVTYFHKWKAIASENQVKVRRILIRKYIAIWREKTARRFLQEEQAVAHYEETLMRRCKSSWFWHFCSRRVEGWHDQWVKKRTLGTLRRQCGARLQHMKQAENVHCSRITGKTLRSLRDRLRQRQQASAFAEQHHASTVTVRSTRALHIQAKLAPVARSLVSRVNGNLERKALKVWQLHLGLSRQAAEVDRKRILQTTWTNWNDGLRCKALAQKIDERVLVDNLYRWVLQERLKLFQRATNSRLLYRAMAWWFNKIREDRDKLAEAESIFAERQRRRLLAYGMRNLNHALRNREDMQRAAIEFQNERILPKVLELWKDKSIHARRLVKWAADARFYCLCSSTIKTWHERTTEHQRNRRREAYVQVRTRIKIRLVGSCFRRWRAKCQELRDMSGEAERRSRERLNNVGVNVLRLWRDEASQIVELDVRATELDQQKLIASAFSALVTKQNNLSSMDEQAVQFNQEINLSLLAGALRRIQWATFTATRKSESAEALLARNRDQHIKQMLRHWVGQAASKKAATQTDPEHLSADPDSPSLRPASRTAMSSAAVNISNSPPLQRAAPSTPGYMRTPSRARRAGRFRPLPTPAPVTPMAFDSTYFATTPAPLQDTYGNLEKSYLGLTPQVTPFERKLRAGGIKTAPSVIRSSVLRRSPNLAGQETNKSVRFAGASRFEKKAEDSHVKNS